MNIEKRPELSNTPSRLARVGRWFTVLDWGRLTMILSLICAVVLLFAAMDRSVRNLATLGLFMGSWTCFCIMLGQHLSYKRHVEASPFPPPGGIVDSDKATQLLVKQLLDRKIKADAPPPAKFKL